MPLTVASIEREMLKRIGPLLTKVGLDGTTANGSNDTLGGPILAGVLALGIEPADPIAVADADVVGVGGYQLFQLLDNAELAALDYAWGNWPEFDQSKQDTSQSFSQLADRIAARIKELQGRVQRPYGPAATSGALPGPGAHGRLMAGHCDIRMRYERPWEYAAWRACQ